MDPPYYYDFHEQPREPGGHQNPLSPNPYDTDAPEQYFQQLGNGPAALDNDDLFNMFPHLNPNAVGNGNNAAPGPASNHYETHNEVTHEHFDRTTMTWRDVGVYVAPTRQMQHPGNGRENVLPQVDANDTFAFDQPQASQNAEVGHQTAQAGVDLCLRRLMQDQEIIPRNTLHPPPIAAADQAQNQGNNGNFAQVPRVGEVPATDGLSRGKLQLAEVGEGKCTFRSKQNNICNRNAPILQVVNGPYECFCMCTSKHLPQWRRSHALLPSIRLIPKTLAQAKAEIYPAYPPLGQEHLYRDPTLRSEAGQELKWQRRFLAAALAPYDGSTKKLQDQQAYLNGNVECDTEGHYSEDQVNSRIALLYHIAWNIHVGGERLYAIFGDNDGYPKEPRRLTFLRRLETMEDLLRTNKRIVLDVIQGRGVGAFVETPMAFVKRKATNNTNNENKKREAPNEAEGGEQEDDEEVLHTPIPLPRKKRAIRRLTAQAKQGGEREKKAEGIPAVRATIKQKPEEFPRHFYGAFVPTSSVSPAPLSCEEPPAKEKPQNDANTNEDAA